MKLRGSLGFLAALTLVGAYGLYCFPPYDLKVYAERSYTVYDRQGNLLSYTLSSDDTFRFDCRADEVDPLYLNMLLSSEDKRFYSHPGVDPLALCRAVYRNLLTKSITSGASTLAMQVIRNLGKNPRTLSSKLKEALGAIVLTFKEGQDQVLRLYLTLAPFGANIEGIKAASLKWFGHLPNHLTPAEAALLVALPRAPEAIRPDRHPQAARYYRNEVLRLAVAQGVISRDILEAATQEKIPERLLPLPHKAYQLLGYARSNRKTEHDFDSLIDANVQEVLLKTAANYREQHQDGSTISAVIIDLRDNSLVGYLGSAALEDSYLDLPHALRSPGSALKPFIYGLAFEQHLLHPKTIVADQSVLYGTWEPHNFNQTFSGEISAANALCLSLNIPALHVLTRVDPGLFFQKLNQRRMRLMLPYGASPQLSLALGGCGINLLDLTELYAMLNRDGLYQPARFFPQDKTEEEWRLLSPHAARAVFETLKQTARPDPYHYLSAVSYKTGTSYGYRDAVALGSIGHYTIGVWTGKPDNTPNPGKTGFNNAAPYLFEICSKLQSNSYYKPELAPIDALSMDAPLNLKKLSPAKELIIDPMRLKLEFPLGGEMLYPDSEGYISLRFKGGVKPIYLTVNGMPQSDPHCFKPLISGEHQISLLDSAGHAIGVKVNIRLKEPLPTP